MNHCNAVRHKIGHADLPEPSVLAAEKFGVVADCDGRDAGLAGKVGGMSALGLARKFAESTTIFSAALGYRRHLGDS